MKLECSLDDYKFALEAIDVYRDQVKLKVRNVVYSNGKLDADLIEQFQHIVHGFAWLSAYGETLQASLQWAHELEAQSKFSELEKTILAIGFNEYLNQIIFGLAMSQDEVIRPIHFQTEKEATELRNHSAVARILQQSLAQDLKKNFIELIIANGVEQGVGDVGLDFTGEMIRDQIKRFVKDEITPYAGDWHNNNELIPAEVIKQMAELGVFGITVPTEYGGMGLGVRAMCVVTEELSKGYIGAGSLGTRTEIACELIKSGGTQAQKNKYLPKLAAGTLLPTAVFTEPDIGSDLANLKTRATHQDDKFVVTGNKTWITHASRTDLMTMLVRTNPNEKGYKGLSMLLAEKPRGTDNDLFPADGMDGSEIHVLGYRGMREYELSFDGFEVPEENLLGGEEGKGFKQLMATFESARIQTAARAVGVAQNAFELGFNYACDRIQFSKPIISFPRVYGKLATMAVEIMLVRQLTYHAARVKEAGKRSDVEAGMAKLLAARVAWSAADNTLQIHGGNGYSLEYPISRVLVDSRILNVFEGAAEIQAQVIAKNLLA